MWWSLMSGKVPRCENALVLVCYKLLSRFGLAQHGDNLGERTVREQEERDRSKLFIGVCMKRLRAGGLFPRCITGFPAYSARTGWDGTRGMSFECSVINTAVRATVDSAAGIAGKLALHSAGGTERSRTVTGPLADSPKPFAACVLHGRCRYRR